MLTLMSERPSQIQLDFLERIKNGTEGHENGGPKGGGWKMGVPQEKEGGRGRKKTMGSRIRELPRL